ncbi:MULTISPECIES: hypothetical protein [Rhizobium]|uniref:Uncharacterized protein n=1 Tax=Rhizobium phaseoli TaxID=396 RepID=A0A7T0EGH7_9HYPH|nr:MULTISPECIES: hypothetical protein [Rhizobium]UWU38739.1 hypothetical protein N2597_32110 [Rhizobium leguminosarum bv. phaseoli]ANL55986.1 hypothetical protein AMC86_PB00230 [Rhizobium phaseoli]MDE8763220.1 hypothetical protein [Rhizobium sp. CBK13]QPK11312.1 hypothetical protein HER27_023515 [Rhizobium phaseoli]ULR41969.1 hypothetical protein MHI61_01400 [Rhizobium sp. K102]
MPRRIFGFRRPQAFIQEDHHGNLGGITAAKGMAALHLSRKVNVQYKSIHPAKAAALMISARLP